MEIVLGLRPVPRRRNSARAGAGRGLLALALFFTQQKSFGGRVDKVDILVQHEDGSRSWLGSAPALKLALNYARKGESKRKCTDWAASATFRGHGRVAQIKMGSAGYHFPG